MTDNRTDIVLGVVYNAGKDKVLAARRPRHSHLGGLWEFPGGKVRNGENALQALKRELSEEINIDIRDCTPLISFDYDYLDKSLSFSVWRIHGWAGKLMGGYILSGSTGFSCGEQGHYSCLQTAGAISHHPGPG